MTDYPEAKPYVPIGLHITSVERMSDAFSKYWLSDGRALHHFTQAEPHADPHDHPCRLDIEILDGGYVEEVFVPGLPSLSVARKPGTTHTIMPEHIHRIAHLPTGECWTLCTYYPHERETRFWQFRSFGTWSRPWHNNEWTEWRAP